MKPEIKQAIDRLFDYLTKKVFINALINGEDGKEKVLKDPLVLDLVLIQNYIVELERKIK